jgi:uncharacterized protein YndB with AHSA1/START domain
MTERFIYVTYIRTTADKLWDALTKPEFTREYWFGSHQDCAWEPDAAWNLAFADGTVTDRGRVLEIDRPNRLVLSWRHALRPELTEEGETRASFTLEPRDAHTIKLTVTHEIDRKDSAFLKAVSNGWPLILSSLKTMLENGQALEGTNQRPNFCTAA